MLLCHCVMAKVKNAQTGFTSCIKFCLIETYHGLNFTVASITEFHEIYLLQKFLHIQHHTIVRSSKLNNIFPGREENVTGFEQNI